MPEDQNEETEYKTRQEKEEVDRLIDRTIWRNAIARQEGYNSQSLIKLDKIIELLQKIHEGQPE